MQLLIRLNIQYQMEPYSQKHSVPPLQIPPQAAQQTTNESITSIEEEPSNRSVSEQLQQIQYQSEKGNVQIQTQITDPRLYSYIITHAGERKTKQEYENPSLSQSRGEEADSAREEREVPSKRQLEIDVPAQQDTSLENFGASSIGSNRPQNEISPQDEDVKFVFPPTPQRNLAQQVENYKGEIEEFRHKAAQNEEEFKTKNEALQAELSEMKKRLEASEAEKTALKAVVDKQKNIKKASISIGTDKTAMHKNTQTDESASAASQKMKTIEQKLKVAEKDKADLASTLEKQRTLLMKAESELTNSAKETHALALELEAARQGYESQKKIVASLKSDINSYKAKALRLETENKELLQRGRRTYQPEEKQELREKLSRFEQLSIELSKENEMHKAVVNELKDQLHRVTEKLEHKKVKSKKRKGKVKELKKESDLLKMEVLKVKQMYSDKCEGYKEARNRLQKKLKEREETILSLQNAVGEKKINGKVHQEPIFEWPNNKPEIENEDYIRAKSLENTHKYQFKDLSATLQPGEIRKKLENDQFSVDEQIRADEKAALRSKEEINDFISTHKVWFCTKIENSCGRCQDLESVTSTRRKEIVIRDIQNIQRNGSSNLRVEKLKQIRSFLVTRNLPLNWEQRQIQCGRSIKCNHLGLSRQMLQEHVRPLLFTAMQRSLLLWVYKWNCRSLAEPKGQPQLVTCRPPNTQKLHIRTLGQRRDQDHLQGLSKSIRRMSQ
eukprot:TRINITY_DN120527_c0_g1_i1.p2 TRINITY_DN120527_c0_g1~~TRINITY_DN120527_c0_g1_i1.p2  ORF type:complete len:730 (+),score=107.11 TRINITY_DN120527_c0_g1_i1:5454-7643(+)